MNALPALTENNVLIPRRNALSITTRPIYAAPEDRLASTGGATNSLPNFALMERFAGEPLLTVRQHPKGGFYAVARTRYPISTGKNVHESQKLAFNRPAPTEVFDLRISGPGNTEELCATVASSTFFFCKPRAQLYQLWYLHAEYVVGCVELSG